MTESSKKSSQKTKTKRPVAETSNNITTALADAELKGLKGGVVRFYKKQKAKIEAYKSRRPHRSFKLTRRRDYTRNLDLPGYISFTHEVNKTLWKYRKTFGLLTLIHIVLYALLVGLGSQEVYNTLSDTVSEASSDVAEEGLGAISQAFVIFTSITTSGLREPLTDAQQGLAVFLMAMVWLTTVWILRNALAGHKVRLRDGLYSSGAPLFATIIMILVLVIQAIPIIIASVGYSAASSSGLLTGGVEAMLFWLAAGLLGVLSIFWMTSTLFAMVIITLPGMYPMRALSLAGDMVTGRRVRVLLRWLWMIFVVAMIWVAIMLPTILLESWLVSVWPDIAIFPTIPVFIVILTASTTVWISAYVYLMYRKIIDNEI